MTENALQPTDSDPAWSWLALSLISGIGYKKIRQLSEHLGKTNHWRNSGNPAFLS